MWCAQMRMISFEDRRSYQRHINMYAESADFNMRISCFLKSLK